MGLLDRLFGRRSNASAQSVVEDRPLPEQNPPDPDSGAPGPGEPPPAEPGNGDSPPPESQSVRRKKGMFDRIESKVRRKVDMYVDSKADSLLDQAKGVAEDFRAETLREVERQALELLDLAEDRIDEKLVEIEKMLDARLRAELKMKLRAMLWTLGFVLIMALVSFAYVWVKRHTGLENDEQAGNQAQVEGNP